MVSTETDGAKQLLGINGNLVPVEDPVALARAIAEVLDDEKNRSKSAAAMLERVASMFDLERMIAETEKVYGSVLTEG